MKITLQRFKSTEKSTIGLLSIDGQFECFTLEDPVREKKKRGVTAIPAGTYDIKLRSEGSMIKRYQAKFGETDHPGMLWLQDVPNFKWVYIHIGNTPDNTEGCILVAKTYDARQEDVVGVSTKAYKDLYPKILQALQGEDPVIIEIR